ncbi:adenylate cyclase [Cupriavidus sp. UYMMa02A]|nr:adenylate cyclase [Cupriavidus sp. UYMMa02A]
MNAPNPLPPFAGKTFEVRYAGLTAINAYADDGIHMRYEITEGAFAGATGEVAYTWRHLADEIYAISWQEADRATVVHIDDFAAGTSHSFYTAPSSDFYRLEGSLRPRSTP